MARLHGRLRAAQRAVLGHAAPARQQLDRARGRRQAAGARLQVRGARRRAHASSGRRTTRWCASSRRRACAVDDASRPFVIIDPRAGHGPGIGGFKEDSEVGVALRAGHPVYFVIFYPEPEPRPDDGRRVPTPKPSSSASSPSAIPQSPKPVIVGNCQGGWAVMMLAAARPDITGPLVINGAPMSYWSGNDGDNPMRYAGGLLGGTWLVAARERPGRAASSTARTSSRTSRA